MAICSGKPIIDLINVYANLSKASTPSAPHRRHNLISGLLMVTILSNIMILCCTIAFSIYRRFFTVPRCCHKITNCVTLMVVVFCFLASSSVQLLCDYLIRNGDFELFVPSNSIDQGTVRSSEKLHDSTILTTTKRPISPMTQGFVVCVKFKVSQGMLLHRRDGKAFKVRGYTEQISLCRKSIVFRTFLVKAPSFYELQGQCMAEYGRDFYTVEIIVAREEPNDLNAKFWTPIRIQSGGVFGRARFKISNNGSDEMAAVDWSHWMVEQVFYGPPYCGITALPNRTVMDNYGPSDSGTIPQGFRSLNLDVGTLSCKSGSTKVNGQRGLPKVYGYAEFYAYCNEAYSFCAFHMPEKAFEAFDGFCPKLTTFVGTMVAFTHKDGRDYHCVLRQSSNVFYPTQLDNYEYNSFMNFDERFQEDEIYRKIGCPLA